MPLIALTRPVPNSLGECELTHVPRVPVDLPLARAQHAEYERALEALGCAVASLPAAHHLPDSVFVEDTAVVLDELAIIARPGAASRRPETGSVALALSRYRPVTFIVGPATLDGGDVLRLARAIYVGIGSRTNRDGVRQFADAVRLFGYTVRPVEVRGCLHLKSAVTEAAPDTVLLNPEWVDPADFSGFRTLAVDPAEPHAANVLRIGETVLCPSAWHRTAARLEGAGLVVQLLDVSELAKAEAGLTCCSLLVPHV